MPLIAQRYHPRAGAVLARLHEIHSDRGWLSEEDLRTAARDLAVPLSQIYSAAAFYSAFSLKPRGRHTAQVCLGTACYIRGGDRLLEKIEASLGVKEGETSQDGMFTVETVHCLGSCSMSPVMRIDDRVYGRLRVDRVARILKKFTKGTLGENSIEEQEK